MRRNAGFKEKRLMRCEVSYFYDLTMPFVIILSGALPLLFPMPASNVLNVSLLGAAGAKATVQISSLNGKALINQTIVPNSPQAINISRIPKGVYRVKVKEGDTETVSKFMKE